MDRSKNGKTVDAHTMHTDSLKSTARSSKLNKAEENKFFLVETGFEVLFYKEDGAMKKLVVVIQAGFDRSFNKFE